MVLMAADAELYLYRSVADDQHLGKRDKHTLQVPQLNFLGMSIVVVHCSYFTIIYTWSSSVENCNAAVV